MKTTLLFIALPILWGSAFIGAKEMVTHIPFTFGAFLRVFVTLIFFYIYFLAKKSSLKIKPQKLWKPWIIGLFMMGFPFMLWYWGQQHISVGLGGILNATVPMWIFILGFIFFRKDDKFTITGSLGIIIGLIGVVIVILPTQDISLSSKVFLGSMALILTAMCYAIGSVLIRHIMVSEKDITDEANIFHQCISSSIFLIVMSFVLGEKLPAFEVFLKPSVLAATLYTAVFSTAIAYLAFFALIKAIGVVKTGTATYFIPIVAVLSGIAIYGEPILFNYIIGMLVILFGVYLTNKK